MAVAQVGDGGMSAAAGGERVEAVEDHGELGGGESQTAVGDGRGRMPADFQSLAPRAQSASAPVQHFDAVGGAVGEHEQVAGHRVGVRNRAAAVGPPVEPEAEVDGTGDPQLGGGRDGRHGNPSTPRTTAAITSAVTPAGKRTTAPLGRANAPAGATGDGVTRMGTTVGGGATAGDAAARVRRQTEKDGSDTPSAAQNGATV